uniref:Uncharacterized protein n=1 Tax=Anguilla anguilla TaxID=7936 RepID=A0A0E9WBF0_ANGAN
MVRDILCLTTFLNWYVRATLDDRACLDQFPHLHSVGFSLCRVSSQSPFYDS